MQKVTTVEQIVELTNTLRASDYEHWKEFSLCCQALDVVATACKSPQLDELLPDDCGTPHALFHRGDQDVIEQIAFFVYDYNARRLTICHFWIHPALRRRGRGRHMFEEITGRLDANSVSLGVTASSRPFWERLGFTNTDDGGIMIISEE